MTVKMKTVVTYRATATCPTHARTEIPVRDLSVVIDEPTERGGTNLGPTPTETAMTALIAAMIGKSELTEKCRMSVIR